MKLSNETVRISKKAQKKKLIIRVLACVLAALFVLGVLASVILL